MGGMYVLGGSRSSGGKRAGPTIYEMNACPQGRSGREMLRLVGAGLAITWRAGRRELITMTALEVVSGIGVAAEVVVGRRVLEAILATQHTSAGLASVWPSFALLAAITAVLGMAGVVLRVVESGTHEELMAAAGTYAELFTLQASPYQWVAPAAGG